MFENIIYPFMVILLIMNGSFVAMSFLPVTADGSMTLADVWDKNAVHDMNSTLNIFGDQFNIVKDIPTDSNTEATTDSTTVFDPLRNFVFGIANAIGTGIGAAFALMKFMGTIFFGYFFWLDMLLNPLWHPLVAGMNLMLKTIFFVITLVGLVSFTKGLLAFRN